MVESVELIRSLSRPIILGLILLGLWAGLGRARFEGRTRLVTWLAIAVPLLAWFAVIWELAQMNAFRFQPGGPRIPALPLAIIIPVAIGLVALTRSRRVAAMLDAIPATWPVAIQAFRVLGGVFLLRWAQGGLPGEFALPAGSGDVLVGLLALPVAFYLASGARGGTAATVAWNILGIADLILAITMGALTSPGPQQMFAFDHPNTLSGDPSLILIPAYFVPLFLIVHGLSLWQLWRRRAFRGGTMAPPAAARA